MNIRQKIKQAVLKFVGNDSSLYPRAQAFYSGKQTEVVRHSPYGLCTNPPKNSIGILFEIQGREAVKYGIFDFMTGRFKNLKEGEVQLGNYLTKASIKFSQNGDIIVNIPNGNLIANVSGNADINVSGDTDINSVGDVKVKSEASVYLEGVNLHTSFQNIYGNNFNIDNAGNIYCNNVITDVAEFNTHVHVETDSITEGPQ